MNAVAEWFDSGIHGAKVRRRDKHLKTRSIDARSLTEGDVVSIDGVTYKFLEVVHNELIDTAYDIRIMDEYGRAFRHEAVSFEQAATQLKAHEYKERDFVPKQPLIQLTDKQADLVAWIVIPVCVVGMVLVLLNPTWVPFV